MKVFFLWMICASNLAMAQMSPVRVKPNYPRMRVWAPVEVEITDENEIVQLFCRTKQLTNVQLPLDQGENISQIMVGDDSRIWSVHGKETQWFTTKPSNLAFQTTAAIRTNKGRVFHFRLFNLSFEADLFEFETEEEQSAFDQLRRSYAGHDPYHNVVIRFREDALDISEATRIAELEARLETQLKSAEAQMGRFRAEKRQLEAQFRQKQALQTRNYAALVDLDYRVRYKKRRFKRKTPVLKVFSDGVFTWVKVTPGVSQMHLYELKSNGKYEVVNFTNEENLYRIDRVCDRLEFRNEAKGDWLFRIERED